MCCRTSSTVLDFDMHRCKACSKPSARLRDMTEFDKKLNMSIRACFALLTAIDVKENDKICRKCLRMVQKCSQFVEMCEKNEARRAGGGMRVAEIDGEEIEEEIECDAKEEMKMVRFEEPPEEAYESDFEQQTSEDEGIIDDHGGNGIPSVLQFYCTVCRKWP